MLRADQIARPEVITTHPRDLIDKAISLMDEHGIHHLPVVEREKVVGMLSDRDILLAVGWQLSSSRSGDMRHDFATGSHHVEQIMSAPVLTMAASETVRKAAGILVNQRIGALPLVSAGRMCGILTASDILSQLLPSQDANSPWARLGNASVRDHMRAKVFTAKARDPLSEIVRIFRDKQVRHVPIVVMGRSAESFLVGIVSDRDVRRALGTASMRTDQSAGRGEFYVGPTCVMDIMTTDVHTIAPHQSLADAADAMLTHRIHALPVIVEQALAGIITQTDILRAVSSLEAA